MLGYQIHGTRRHDDIAQDLRRVGLFSKCSTRDLAAVAKAVEVESCEPGTRIVTQGQAGDAFYVIIDGSASVQRNGQHVGELGAGDYFGELALLDPAPRNADVVAETHITILRLGFESFRSVVRSIPAINERLLSGLARRVRDGDGRQVAWTH
jgi:CRP-like cAMP-binding protein